MTGQATLLWVEAKSVELRESCHGIVKEMTAILTTTPRRRRAGKAGSGDHCHCHHVDFLIGGYPRVGKYALIQKLDKLDYTTSRMLEDQATFDNHLKTIRLHREDYEARLESMMVQQQRVVNNMIKYLETVQNRMRELEKRGGIATPVPGPGPDLPRDPAPESLLSR